MRDEDLLRRYVRESLKETRLLDEKGALGGSLSSIAGGFLTPFTGGEKKSGPQKWFEDFIGDKMSVLGKKLDMWLGKKLESMLPDEFLQAIEKSGKNRKEASEEASTGLARVVSTWIEDIEDVIGDSIPREKKREISEFAADEFSKYLKKYPEDPARALQQVKRALDMKYASSVRKKKNDGKKSKED